MSCDASLSEREPVFTTKISWRPLSGDLTIVDVYRWVLKREQDTPKKLLRKAGADDAIERLENVYAYTERQRDGIIGTAAVQLKAYGHPGAARTASRTNALTPEQLFANGEANTLYIVAGREHQQLLAPLVVTLLSSLLHHLSETENRNGHGLWPPALFALDETANIAPLQDLPQILATSLPSARFFTVWHSIAQIHRHYAPAGAGEILALSQAKIFRSPTGTRSPNSPGSWAAAFKASTPKSSPPKRCNAPPQAKGC